MKTLTEFLKETFMQNNNILNESNDWYISFIKIFETDAEGILRAGGKQFKKAGMVTHRGSSKSRVFGIRYLSSGGVWCSYEFEIKGPGPKSQGVYAHFSNPRAEELIQKNIKKLPKLRYDSLGNILN